MMGLLDLCSWLLRGIWYAENAKMTEDAFNIVKRLVRLAYF